MTTHQQDPFVLAKAIAAGDHDARVAPAAAAEIRRLVAWGDLFGAGLVAATAIGRPLKAFGLAPVVGVR
jgi:hypothetical protein